MRIAAIGFGLGLSLVMSNPALAQDTPLPEVWKAVPTVPATAGPDPVSVPIGDYSTEQAQLVGLTMEVREWMQDSTDWNTDQEDRIVALEKEVAALRQEIEALKQQQPGQPGKPVPDPRIDEILARLDALEKAQGTVKAPFKVVGPGGAAVLMVTAEGDALFGNPPVLTVRTSKSGEVSLALGAGGAGAVVLTAAGDSGKVVATGPEADVTLGSAAEVVGLLVEKGGQPAAGLGGLDGRPVALRLFSASGGTIVAGGENPSSPGSGILYVGDGSQNLAALAGDGAGGGIVHAFAPDGTVGAGLVGAERMVAAYNAAGSAVATIMKSDKSEGGNVTTRDPSGEGVFSAGFNSEVGGGDACVYRAKRQNVSCLGISLPGMGLVNP